MGPAGPTGATGPTGAIDPTTTLINVTASNGSVPLTLGEGLVFESTTLDIAVSSGSAVVTIEGYSITGPTGPQGPQGPAGPAGADGADGATGPQGPQGPAGPAGADGADGATGPQGPQGPTGPAGSDGADGATGPQGPQGPAGADGADGAIGPQGPQGLAGPAGADGADGATGPQGPQGPPGPAGPAAFSAYGGIYNNTPDGFNLTGGSPLRVPMTYNMASSNITYETESRVSVHQSGDYEINYSLHVGISNSTEITLAIRRGGTNIPESVITRTLPGLNDIDMSGSIIISLSANDVLDMAIMSAVDASVTRVSGLNSLLILKKVNL